jgi:adenine-specific DNA-methyltransferase
MKFKIQSPKNALKSLIKQPPFESERDKFKINLLSLIDKISIIEKQPIDESEEHLKNNLRDFLRDTYYIDSNAINTKDKKDLVIHIGKSTDTNVAVIIEAKRPSNDREMVSIDNANKKAFYELIFYYLNERKKNENIELKKLVLTDINQWFIIDANWFDRFISDDPQIKKIYSIKINDKKSNPWFYEEIAKIITKSDLEIPCVYFNIRDYEPILKNTKIDENKDIIALYKILSPQSLLKIIPPNDNNSLNGGFYKELLYIIGLEEVKEGTKNIIRRKKENINDGSIIELTIESLITEDAFHRIPDIKFYGENHDEQIFNIALELCITWINRILFLKLLEGQLISYHQDSKEDYHFLNTENIKDYDELFKLFHKVLAVNIPDRSEAIRGKYSRVPYLNSSLFEISTLEDQTIKINSLENNFQLEIFKETILVDTKKKVGKLPSLDYLLYFLDSYNFASEGIEDWRKDNKQLINASVLGKVFEKINGYRDGSIFTPDFITIYMCRQSIRLAVVEKFNEIISEKGKKLFDKFEDVKNYTSRHFKTDDVIKANQIINSLRICDPAVGSGHFLVSALNEIIYIKAELGILSDDKGNILSGYEIEILNDELKITDHKDNPVEYKIHNGKPISKEIQRLQKTLFHEKQTIIENCLFGVDINPKSVLICRLRLWIELLKNAYYKENDFSELETLPNIDINIKCGNSLLNRFPLDADLSKILKNIKYDIEQYRNFVNDYKNEKNKDLKKDLQKIIYGIKSDFNTEIIKSGKDFQNWYKAKGEFDKLTLQYSFFEMTQKEKKKFNENLKIVSTKLKKYEVILDKIRSNALYKNAFEWRFEFPEILNNNGDFDGFDLTIGNPPYIKARDAEKPEIRNIIEHNFPSAEKMWDIYIPFIEQGLRILKPSGKLSYIIPDTIGLADYTKKIVEIIETKHQLLQIDFYPDHYIFDGVGVKNKIILLNKKNNFEGTRRILHRPTPTSEIVLPQIDTTKKYLPETTEFQINLINTLALSEICFVSYGLRLNSDKDDKDFKFKKDDLISEAKSTINNRLYTEGKYLDRFIVKKKLYVEWGTNRCPDRLVRATFPELYNPEKLLLARQKRIAAYSDEKLICDNTIIMAILAKDLQNINNNSINKYYKNLNAERTLIENISHRFKLKYILAIINSKLIAHFIKYNNQGNIDFYPDDWKKIPIKDIPLTTQQPFINLVDNIILLKEQGKDSSELENEIDLLVYDLYDVSPKDRITINQE